MTGQKLEILIYPLCGLKCRSQMIGHKFKDEYLKPDSDAFRGLFPTLHVYLSVGGRIESFCSQTVSHD